MTFSTLQMRKDAEAIVSGIELPRIPEREFRLEFSNSEDIVLRLNETIRTCSASGGGRIILPAGFFRCGGPIRMQSCVELHLEKGCFIKFSPDPELYLPPVYTRWGGVEIINYSPMIYGNELTDCAITGEGVFCGGREKWGNFQALQTPARTRSHTLELEGVPVDKRIFGEGCFMRPSMLQFRQCRRILLEGISLIDAPLWMIHPLFCSHVTIRHVTTDSMYVCNDGIDVDSCTDVLIEKSNFRNGDDAVVLKSGRDADGRRVGMANKRIVVRDCVFHDCMHGFAIGSELSGGCEDVYVYNIHMEYIWAQAISFKSCPGRGGVIHRLHIADIQIDKTDDHAISIVSEYPGTRFGEDKTCYKDIEFCNIHCNYAKNGLYLEGSKEFPLERILLDNVVVDEAEKPIDTAVDTGTLSFNNVYINNSKFDSAN
jgi:polygalacturonase